MRESDHKESWAPKNWCFWTVVLKKTLESPLDCKIKLVNSKGNQSWIFTGRTDAEILVATWCEELTHWKRSSWCWERLKAGGEGDDDDRGWDAWMAPPIQWTWVWARSGSWWWTGRPGVLQFIGWQRVGHNWVTELNWMHYYDLASKQHPYLFLCFYGKESGLQLAVSSASAIFTRLQLHCPPGLASHLKLYHFQVCKGIGRIQFLGGCQTENLQFLLTLGFLPHGSLHKAAYFIRASKGESQRESITAWLKSKSHGVIFDHYCCILWLETSHVFPPTFRRRGSQQAMNNRRKRLEPLRAYLPQCFSRSLIHYLLFQAEIRWDAWNFILLVNHFTLPLSLSSPLLVVCFSFAR